MKHQHEGVRCQSLTSSFLSCSLKAAHCSRFFPFQHLVFLKFMLTNRLWEDLERAGGGARLLEESVGPPSALVRKSISDWQEM